MSNPVERLALVLRTMAAKYADRLNAMKARAKDLEREDFIWHALIESFATWGNSRGAEGLEDPTVRERLDYDRVMKMPREERTSHLIGVFREAKVRYPERRADHLVRNGERIAVLGGLGAARAKLLAQSGFDAKAAFLETFEGIGEKCSRAILMGIYDVDARDRIALDSRVREVNEALDLDYGGDYERYTRRIARAPASG